MVITLLWALGDLVLVAHIALFLLLVAGVTMSAAGRWRPGSRAALVFWPVLALTLAWAVAPVDCPLAGLETWLRQREVPGWERQLDLPEHVTTALLGVQLHWVVYRVLGIGVLALDTVGFWRSWGTRARALARIHRRTA